MPENAFSWSQVESPATGATLPRGRHILRGWVWPRPGGHFVDVRARIGDRLFPGVHGFPRADLAAHFQTGQPLALAEFQVAVELAPGAAEVVLEALEIEGRWAPFQIVSYQVLPAATPDPAAPPGGALRWIDYGHGLRQLLREVSRRPDEPLAGLATELAAQLPFPRMLREAPAPLIGYIDEPAMVCCSRFGRIPAFGHLFHPTQRITRILGTVDLQAWQSLAMHQPSPGPAVYYAQYPNAAACGFLGLIDVPAQLPNPVSLRIYAELEDGSLHLGPVVRTRLHSSEEEKNAARLHPPTTLAAVIAVWDQALAARGLPVTRDAELDNFMAALRAEQEAGSRPALRPPSASRKEPRPIPRGPLPRKVLLATHGLSRQGAPRFLLEYGRALAAAGVQLTVVSAEDAPLRSEFAALGAEIVIVDVGPLLQADTASAAAAIARIAGRPIWSAADLVVANSFTTFWAVHAAKAAGRPALLYVHESTTPGIFYGGRMHPAVISLAEDAFTLADLVSFTTASTRQYHRAYGRPECYRVTPGWVDIAALDRQLAGLNRDVVRRSLGVQPGELLVCNIGTVSDRKGQHTFARAVDLLWRRHPALAARTKFILLGGRDSPFDTMLGDLLAELGRSNLVVHPETADYLRYYLAADVFACSSYEESSPLVVFEAMVCRAPILASAVHGIPELVRPDLEARLLPAGDTAVWCEGLARLLAAPEAGQELAARARARVEEHFAAPIVLPQHLALAADATYPRA